MVLGTYYLTQLRSGAKGEGRQYTGINETLLAYEAGVLDLQAEIEVQGKKTSLGRMIFNEQLPKGLQTDAVMNKKELGRLVAKCFKLYGGTRTAEVIDAVKGLGYHYACLAGMTVSISDVIIPPQKGAIIESTQEKVRAVENNYRRGIITERERYDKVCTLWNQATLEVADAMMNNMDAFNPIYMMSDSGARGNKQQMRQLAGMRGLMADPSGKIIEEPITANFREGLSVSDYFISSHGARKGLADTALRTADSGYLTRRLVDVAQDVIVRMDDCDVLTVNLVMLRARLAEDTFDALELLSEMLLGRILAKSVVQAGEVVLEQNTRLDNDALVKLGEISAKEIVLRGSSRSRVNEVIMLGSNPLERQKILDNFIRENAGKRLAATDEVLTAERLMSILADDSIKHLQVRVGNIRGIEVEAVLEDTRSNRGVIESLYDRILGRTLAEDVYDGDVLIGRINDSIDEDLAEAICKVRSKVLIRSVLTCRATQGVCRKCYGRDLANATPVEIGEAVGIIAAQSIGEPGTQLTMRTFHTGGVAGGDITQGLPRVEELFEARKPKNAAIIAEIDGVVQIGHNDKNQRVVTIRPYDANQAVREYASPTTRSRREPPSRTEQKIPTISCESPASRPPTATWSRKSKKSTNPRASKSTTNTSKSWFAKCSTRCKSLLGIRCRGGTATRASCLLFCGRKTCLFCRTGLPSISCSIRSACQAA